MLSFFGHPRRGLAMSASYTKLSSGRNERVCHDFVEHLLALLAFSAHESRYVVPGGDDGLQTLMARVDWQRCNYTQVSATPGTWDALRLEWSCIMKSAPAALASRKRSWISRRNANSPEYIPAERDHCSCSFFQLYRLFDTKENFNAA